MGQGISKEHASYVFGHAAATDFLEDQHTSIDRLLYYPEEYAFDTCSPLENHEKISTDPSVTVILCQPTLGRTDSGYASCNEKTNHPFVRDVNYIDKTYYTDGRPLNNLQKPNDEDEDNKNIHLADPLTFADVTKLASDPSMQEVNLSNRALASLSPNIGLLTMIRKLDLSDNLLTSVPNAIGYLHHLQVLSLAGNKLTEIPDTIGYLGKLTQLDLSRNQLERLTPCIGYLRNLRDLCLDSNQLAEIPIEITAITGLISLDLSYNPLRRLPAEISNLSCLRRMQLDDCPLDNDPDDDLVHDPPSLLEICARTILRDTVKIPRHYLPDHLTRYLESAKPCTSCSQPYFESYVVRTCLVERGDRYLPIEYRLCSAHWSDADDRLRAMFSQTMTRPSSPFYEFRRPNCLLHPNPKQVSDQHRSFHLPRIRQSIEISTPLEDLSDTDGWRPKSGLKKWRSRQHLAKMVTRNQAGFLNFQKLKPSSRQ
ncbi:uncharacterized protein BYT42DRAFT_567451 [Radiomyces spectabilis]|uniref:uncharacterized protein n=1 Tax=Radiomyces spectabilis TaxID=64574 RepID=UPI00222117C7|nr:uncharacterized protein BYT42DRAFT_567451 [Radiomyces spectabilis]KAI8379094.1 hypothetical protein BYT42DRAFT_567451 [Radiomyces spectabilis]